MRASDFHIVANTSIQSPCGVALRLITGTTSSLNLHPDDVPILLCPQLAVVPIRPEDPNSVPAPPYLEAVDIRPDNDTHQGKMSIKLVVCDNTDSFLHVADLRLRQPASCQRLIELIFSTLADLHAQDSSDFQLFDDRGNPAMAVGLDMTTLVRNFLNGSYYARFSVHESSLKRFRGRIWPIEEDFVKTEESYVRTLTGFRENVEPVLRKIPALPESVVLDLMEAAGRIYYMHSQLLSQLKETRRDYFFPLGAIFLPHAKEMVFYQQYLEKYGDVVESLNRNEKDRSLKAILERFQESEYAGGLTLESVLIQPIQRGPQYPLMLKEIIKKTPLIHPDYRPLKQGLRLAQQSMARISGRILQASKFDEMKRLQQALHDCPVFQASRWLMGSFTVQKSQVKYVMILFSDEFWIARSEKKGESLELVARLTYFDFWIEKYANQSIAVRNCTLTETYVCETALIRGKLVEKYEEASTMAQARSSENDIVAHWETFGGDLSLAFHAMTGMANDDAGTLYIFGGVNENRESQSDLYMIPWKEDGPEAARKLIGSEVKPVARYHVAMAGTADALYIYGGTVDGKTGLEDFWEWRTTGWTTVNVKGNVKPPPGFAFDLSWFPPADGSGPGSLLLTGGFEGLFRFYQFSLSDSTWTAIEIAEFQLPPYIGHKVFRIQAGCGMIVGGNTATGAYNKSVIWFSSFGRHAKILQCEGMHPPKRIWASCSRIGSQVFVVGGESEYTGFILDVDTQVWSIPKNRGFKNSCPAFYGAASYSDGRSICIHGGFDESDDTEPLFYRVILSSEGVSRDHGPFSIQDCAQDDWEVNIMKNPGSVKDEPWIPLKSETSLWSRL
jgi:hypothetical protein